MSKILVHIGFPKTGTTTLQSTYFSQSREMSAFVQPDLNKKPDTNRLLQDLLEDTDRTSNTAREIIQKYIDKHASVVISDEALSFGEFMRRGAMWNLTTEHDKTAKRLYEKLGSVDIAIVLRNQVDLLTSFHNMRLRKGNSDAQTLSHYIEESNQESKGRFLKALDYHRLYTDYVSVFGESKIHVFFYEQYRDHFSDLGACFAEILNADSDAARAMIGNTRRNVSKPSRFFRLKGKYRALVKVWKWIAPVRKKLPSGLRTGLENFMTEPIPVPNTSEVERMQIMDLFSESNQKLLQILGMEDKSILDKYGLNESDKFIRNHADQRT